MLTDEHSTRVVQLLYLLTDLERSQFEVSSDSDVADHVHANAVWEVEFLFTRKLHFKHVSIHLQRELKYKTCLVRKEIHILKPLQIKPQNVSEEISALPSARFPHLDICAFLKRVFYFTFLVTPAATSL